MVMEKEIGGYIEFDSWKKSSLHRGAIALNSGRNCLLYLVKARKIEKLLLPDYMCDSVADMCKANGISFRLYRIGADFLPSYDFVVGKDEYLYIVDYFGQLSDENIIDANVRAEGRLVVDECQSLFREPLLGIDTLYSARKFLGITDGAYLYTDCRLDVDLPTSSSFDHLNFLFGRLESNANRFYDEYKTNNDRFASEPLRKMSKTTKAMIGAVDLERIKRRRIKNYRYVDEKIGKFNQISLREPVDAPFAYPLYFDNGPAVRKALISKSIYVPTLWPNVLEDERCGSVARDYSKNILPIPIDQRYGYRNMNRVIEAIQDLGLIDRELDGRKIAILGGTQISCEIVRKAKRMGAITYVIDYNSPSESPAKQIADYHTLISVADVDQVVEYINKEGIEGVICGYSDSILAFYARICEKAGLPCYGSQELFAIYTDKAKWKQECRRFNVPTAIEYEKSILDLPESDIPLPLFVKPSVGSGARGTGIARTKSELKDLVKVASLVSADSEVIIEDYLEGREVTVFWIMLDGEYYVAQVGNRLVEHNQPGCIPLPTGYSFPSAIIPSYLANIAPRIKKMFRSQGVLNGMMFMQCIIKDGTPFVYDIGYRLTGSLEHYLQEGVAGYSNMEMLLRYAVTGKMTNDEDIVERIKEGLFSPCFNVSCLMAPGEIAEFKGLDEVSGMAEVIAVSKAHVEGEVLPPEAKGELRQIALRVLGITEDSYELPKVMGEIQGKIAILSPEGRDLKLRGFNDKALADDILVCQADW